MSRHKFSARKISQTGFSIVELLVVVLIITIITSIAVPNFTTSQKRSQIASIKQNMHTTQIAAQAYSVDGGGQFPSDAAGLGPYMTGGGSSISGSAGTFPPNPCSGKKNELPAPCIINKSMFIPLIRTTTGTDTFGGTSGQTTYKGIVDDANSATNNAFAITGNGPDGTGAAAHALLAPHGYFVLSNQ